MLLQPSGRTCHYHTEASPGEPCSRGNLLLPATVRSWPVSTVKNALIGTPIAVSCCQAAFDTETPPSEVFETANRALFDQPWLCERGVGNTAASSFFSGITASQASHPE